MEPNADIVYLAARLRSLTERVASAVARRRAADPAPDDPFRGLYITDGDVDRILLAAPAAADEGAGPGDSRLRRMASEFGLEPIDVELLLIALAPDLDPRFERLYGYLNDDVTRRRATIGLALEMATGTAASASRGRMGPLSPLVAGGLVVVEDTDRPFLTRGLRVPDRVTAHLLGDDTPDEVVAALEAEVAGDDLGDFSALERAVRSGVNLVYVRQSTGTSGTSYAAGALRAAGRHPVAIDLTRLLRGGDGHTAAKLVAREARLRGGAVVAGPVEALADDGLALVRAYAESGCTTVLVGTGSWDPRWSRAVPLLLEVPVLTPAQRERIWRESFDDAESSPVAPAAGSTAHFRLSPEQVARAARSARQSAAAEGRRIELADVHAGARAQNAAGLERLARRIEPRVSWADLVLPAPVLSQLQSLAVRVRYRERVYGDWGMGNGSGRGRGVTALFAGESGTGKTLSAEVVAGDLGLSMYVIDLSTVVDKYIGETEKNLDRIFDEAAGVNGVLLFDEADAIFGKRSEVKDAHDRYANVEVAYLLQRIERFDGLAVLTTNLRANVDEAFTRRLDLLVDFPMPDPPDRRRLWELHLGQAVPRSDDIDLDFLAEAFRLSGGNIRNIALTAAFSAAAAGRPVAMADLVRGIEEEYRKLGHLCLEAEFGRYFSLLGRDQASDPAMPSSANSRA